MTSATPCVVELRTQLKDRLDRLFESRTVQECAQVTSGRHGAHPMAIKLYEVLSKLDHAAPERAMLRQISPHTHLQIDALREAIQLHASQIVERHGQLVTTS